MIYNVEVRPVPWPTGTTPVEKRECRILAGATAVLVENPAAVLLCLP